MSDSPNLLSLAELQSLIETMYSQKDRDRGVEGTFMWLMEEVGELSSALRDGTDEELASEFADVLAWLVTLANVTQIDLSRAVQEKYGKGCPGCQATVCICGTEEKP